MRFDVWPHQCGEVTSSSKNAAAAFVAAFLCPIAHTPTVAKITAPAKLHIRRTRAGFPFLDPIGKASAASIALSIRKTGLGGNA